MPRVPTSPRVGAGGGGIRAQRARLLHARERQSRSPVVLRARRIKENAQSNRVPTEMRLPWIPVPVLRLLGAITVQKRSQIAEFVPLLPEHPDMCFLRDFGGTVWPFRTALVSNPPPLGDQTVPTVDQRDRCRAIAAFVCDNMPFKDKIKTALRSLR